MRRTTDQNRWVSSELTPSYSTGRVYVVTIIVAGHRKNSFVERNAAYALRALLLAIDSRTRRVCPPSARRCRSGLRRRRARAERNGCDDAPDGKSVGK